MQYGEGDFCDHSIIATEPHVSPGYLSARHWGTATTTTTTETEPHVSPGYLSARHWGTQDHAQGTGHTQWHDPNHDESVKDVATSCEDPHTEPHVSPSSPARHWGKSLKTSERSSRSKNYARPNPDVAPPAEGDRGSHGEGKAYKIRASPPPDTAPPAEGDRGSCGEGAVPKLNLSSKVDNTEPCVSPGPNRGRQQGNNAAPVVHKFFAIHPKPRMKPHCRRYAKNRGI